MKTDHAAMTDWAGVVADRPDPALDLARERGYDVVFRTAGHVGETDLHVRVTRGASHAGTARVTFLAEAGTMEVRVFDAPPGPAWREVAALVKAFAEAVFADRPGAVPGWIDEGWEHNPKWFHPDHDELLD